MSVTDDVNAAVLAYREIKARILDLRYAAGEKLSETRLVAELGLGRSPIRTALARLKSEGWIAVTPQKGTYVRSLTEKEIEEMTDLRVLLEMHMARLAAHKIDPVELRRLRRAFDRLQHQPMADHMEEFLEFDAALHGAIYRAADNALIEGILADIRDKVQWLRRSNTVSVRRVERALAELKRVLRALETGDREAAAASMAKHIRNAAEFYKSEERDALERDRRAHIREDIKV
ncbi:MAG TPA: GntR family transcriptional regulator [Alphaproteobacteria bacterium]|nr:GntR family transcriptional regulator [Alphaproteobacteria bacterium]